MHPVSAIIQKLEGSDVAPFLWINFTTDSPQEEGWAPDMNTLLKYVARIWCVVSSLRSVRYVIPHGPGADSLFDFDSIFLISLGLKGAVSNGRNSGFLGPVGSWGNQ